MFEEKIKYEFDDFIQKTIHTATRAVPLQYFPTVCVIKELENGEIQWDVKVLVEADADGVRTMGLIGQFTSAALTASCPPGAYALFVATAAVIEIRGVATDAICVWGKSNLIGYARYT